HIGSGEDAEVAIVKNGHERNVTAIIEGNTTKKVSSKEDGKRTIGVGDDPRSRPIAHDDAQGTVIYADEPYLPAIVKRWGGECLGNLHKTRTITNVQTTSLDPRGGRTKILKVAHEEGDLATLVDRWVRDHGKNIGQNSEFRDRGGGLTVEAENASVGDTAKVRTLVDDATGKRHAAAVVPSFLGGWDRILLSSVAASLVTFVLIWLK